MFQSLKHWHRSVVDEIMRYDFDVFIKIDFLWVFSHIHFQIFKLIIVMHAWKKTNLMSYNSKIVLDSIRRMIVVAREKTSSFSSLSLELKISKNSQKISFRNRQLIMTINEKNLLTSIIRRVVFKYIKNSNANVISRQLSKQEFNQTKSYQAARTMHSSNALYRNTAQLRLQWYAQNALLTRIMSFKRLKRELGLLRLMQKKNG